jgi:hypothetical protein
MSIKVNPRALEAACRKMAERGEQDWNALPPARQALLREISANLLRDYEAAKAEDLVQRRTLAAAAPELF